MTPAKRVDDALSLMRRIVEREATQGEISATDLLVLEDTLSRFRSEWRSNRRVLSSVDGLIDDLDGPPWAAETLPDGF